MSQLRIADSIYIGVLDAPAASNWYVEKLGLMQVVSSGDEEGCVSLAFSKKEIVAITLGPRGRASDGTTPMLYAAHLERERKNLISRGVNVGPIEEDRQGTRYFVICDPDGNKIEITEEPRLKPNVRLPRLFDAQIPRHT
jgi:catechol 2,3-dioxygenase-like lactoylglutathione lyase family enzyme